MGVTSVGGIGLPFELEAMREITEVPSIDVVIICVTHLLLDSRLVVVVFLLLEEEGFNQGRIFTAKNLGIVIGLIVCGGVGLARGLTGRVLGTGNIINYAKYYLSDNFVGDGEVDLLRGGDL